MSPHDHDVLTLAALFILKRDNEEQLDTLAVSTCPMTLSADAQFTDDLDAYLEADEQLTSAILEHLQAEMTPDLARRILPFAEALVDRQEAILSRHRPAVDIGRAA